MQGQGQPSQLASPGLPPAADLQELLNEIQELKAGLLGDSVTHDNPTFEGPPWEHQRTLQSSDGLRLDIPMDDLDDSLEDMVARDARLQYILSPQAEEQVVRSGFRFEQDSSSPQRAVPGPSSLERLLSAGVSPAALPAASVTPVTPIEAGASRVASQQGLSRDAAYATATSSRYTPTATPDAVYATAASSGLTPVAAQLPQTASHTTPSPSATNAAAAQARAPAATPPAAAGTARKIGSRIARPAGVATPGAATGRPTPVASGLPTPSTAPPARTSSLTQPHHAVPSTSGASTAAAPAALTGSAATSTARTGHAVATPPPSTRSKLAAAVNAIGAIATASASRTSSRIPARHAASTTASPGSSVGPLRTGSGSVHPSVATSALGSAARKRPPPQSGPDGSAGAPTRKVATPTGASSAAHASPSSHAHTVTSPAGGKTSRTPGSAAFGSGSKIPVRVGHAGSSTSHASRIASPVPAASPAAAATPKAAAAPPSAFSTADSTPQVTQVTMSPVASSPDEMVCEVSHPSLTLPTIATADFLGGESIESMLRDDPALASWLAATKQVDTAAAVDASKAAAAADSGAAALQRRTSDELLQPLNVAMADAQGGNTWLDDDADAEMSLLMAGGARSGGSDGSASPAAEVVAEAVAAAAAVVAYTLPQTPPTPAPVQAQQEQAELPPSTQTQASQLVTNPGSAVLASRERMGSTVCKVRELLGLDDQQEGHALNSEELWRNITVEANNIFSSRGGPAATAAAVAIAATSEPELEPAAAAMAAAATACHAQPEAEDAPAPTAGDAVAPQRSMSEALSRAMSMQQGPPAHEVALSDESSNNCDEVAAPLAGEAAGVPQDDGGDREGSPGLDVLAAEAAAAAAAVTAGGTGTTYGGGQSESLAEGGASRLLMHQGSSASIGYTASVAFEATMISRQLAGYDSIALRASPPGEEAIMEEGEELVSPEGASQLTAAVAMEALAASGSAVAFDELPELPEPAPTVPAALVAEDETPLAGFADASPIAAAVLLEASAVAAAVATPGLGGPQAAMDSGDAAGLAAAPVSDEVEADAAAAESPPAPLVGAKPDVVMEVDGQGSAPNDSAPFAAAAVIDAAVAMAVVGVKAPKDVSDMAVDDGNHRDIFQAVDALAPPAPGMPLPDTSLHPGALATQERSSQMALDGPGDGGDASTPPSHVVSPDGLSALVVATASAAAAPEPPDMVPGAGGSHEEAVLADGASGMAAAGAAAMGVDAGDDEGPQPRGATACLVMAIDEVGPPSMAAVAPPVTIDGWGLLAKEPAMDDLSPAGEAVDVAASPRCGAFEHEQAAIGEPAGVFIAEDAGAAIPASPVAYPVAISDVSDGGSVPIAPEHLEEPFAGDGEAVGAAVDEAVDEAVGAAVDEATAEVAPLRETAAESQAADAVGVDIAMAAVAAAEEAPVLGVDIETDADEAAPSAESEPAAASAAAAAEVGEHQTGISAPMEAAEEMQEVAVERQAALDADGDPMPNVAQVAVPAAAATAAAVVGFQEAAFMDVEEVGAAPTAAFAAQPCAPMDVEDANASLVASSKLATVTKLPEAPPVRTVEALGATREAANMAIDEPQQGSAVEAAPAVAAWTGTGAAAAVIPAPHEASAHEVEDVAAGLAAPATLAGAAEYLTGAADVGEKVGAAPAAAEATLESAEQVQDADATFEAEAAHGAAGPSAELVMYPVADMEEREVKAEANIGRGTAEATLASAAVAAESQSGSSSDMEEAPADTAPEAAHAPTAAADAAEPLADAVLHVEEVGAAPSGVEDQPDQGASDLSEASSSDIDADADGSPSRAAAAPPKTADLTAEGLLTAAFTGPEDANTAVADATSPEGPADILSVSEDLSGDSHAPVMPADGDSPTQAATAAAELASAPAAAAPAPQAVARSADDGVENYALAVAATASCAAPATAEDAEITDAADAVVAPEVASAGNQATAPAGQVELEGAKAVDPDAEMSAGDSDLDEQMYDAEEDGFDVGQAADVAGHTHSARLSAHSRDGDNSSSNDDDDSGDGVPQELRRKVPAGAGPAIVAAAAATAAGDTTPQRVKYPRVELYSGQEMEVDACRTAAAGATAVVASTALEGASDEEAARSPGGPIAEGADSGRSNAGADTMDPTAGAAEKADAEGAGGGGQEATGDADPSQTGGEVAALGSIPSNATAFACASAMSVLSHVDSRAVAELGPDPAPSGLPQCVSGSIPSDTFSLEYSEVGSRMFTAMAGAAAYTAGHQAATAQAPEAGSFSDASFVTARGMSLLAGVGAAGGAWHGADYGAEVAATAPVDIPRPEAAVAAAVVEPLPQAPGPERSQADSSPPNQVAPRQPAPCMDAAPSASRTVPGVSPAPIEVPASAHPALGSAGEQQQLLHAWQVLVPANPGCGHTESESDGVPHVRAPLVSKLSTRSMLSVSSRLSRVSSPHDDDEAAPSTGALPTEGALAFNLGQGAAAAPEGVEDGSDKTDEHAPSATPEADGVTSTEGAAVAAVAAAVPGGASGAGDGDEHLVPAWKLVQAPGSSPAGGAPAAAAASLGCRRSLRSIPVSSSGSRLKRSISQASSLSSHGPASAAGVVPDEVQYDIEDEESLQPAWKVMAVAGALPDTPEAVAAARGSPLGSQPSFRSSRAGSSRLRRASAPDGEGFEDITGMWQRAAPAGDGMEVDPQPPEASAAAAAAAAQGGGGDDQSEPSAADGVVMGAVVLPLSSSRSRTLPGKPLRSGSAGGTPVASQLGPSHTSHSVDGFPPPPLLRGGSGGRTTTLGPNFGGVHRLSAQDAPIAVHFSQGTMSESGSPAAMLAARASSRRHPSDSIGTVPLPRRSSTGGGDPNVDAMRQAWQVLPLPVSPSSNTPGSGVGGGSVDSGAGLAAAGSTPGAPSVTNMLASMRSSSRLSRMSSGIPEDLLAELRIQAHAAVGHLQGPHHEEDSGGGLADMNSSVEESAAKAHFLTADAGGGGAATAAAAATGATSTTVAGEGAAGDGAGGLVPAWKVLPLRVPPSSSAGAPPEIQCVSPSASRLSALGGRPALVATRSTNASSRLAVSSNKAPALQVSFEPVSPAGRSPGPALPEEEEEGAAGEATTRASAPAPLSSSPRPALNLPHADNDQEEPVVHAWKLVSPSPSGGQASSLQAEGADAASASGPRPQHALGSRRSLKSLGSVGGSRLSRASIVLEDYVDNAYSERVGTDDAGAGYMEVADTANQDAVAAAVAAAAAAAAEEMAPKDEASELYASHSERSSAPAAIGGLQPGVLHGNRSSHDADLDTGGAAADERRSHGSRVSSNRDGTQPSMARGTSALSLKAAAEGSQDSGGAGRALNGRASWRSGSTSGNSRVSRVSSGREAAPWDLEEIREEDPEGAAPQEHERLGAEGPAGRAAAAAAAQPALILGPAHSGPADGEEVLAPAWKGHGSPTKAAEAGAEAAGSRLSAPGSVQRPSCANSAGSSRLSHMASLASEAGLADIVEEGTDGAAAAGGVRTAGVEQTPPAVYERVSSGRAPPPAPSAGAGRIGSPVPPSRAASHAHLPPTTAPPLVDEDGAPLLPAWKVLAPHPAADAPEADGSEQTSPLGTARQPGLRAQRSGNLGNSRLSRMTSGLAEEEQPTNEAASPSVSLAAAAVACGGAEHPNRADAAATAGTTSSEASAAAAAMPTATCTEQTALHRSAAAAGPTSASSGSASGDREAAGPGAGPLADASGQASQTPSTPGVESKSTTQDEHSHLTLANLPSAQGNGTGGTAPRIGSGQFGSPAPGPHAPASGAALQTPVRAAGGAIKEEAVPSPGTPEARPQSPAAGAGAEVAEPSEVSPADVTPEVMPASEEGSPVPTRAVERSASSAGDVPQVLLPADTPEAPRPRPPQRKRGGFLACFACFGGSAGDND